ncbi:MAG: hypothetical protein KGI04_03985 [Candidatus Micrarchaeota archaeon]|nr:hypothetical protein [Candidatus Micrarchaeota archaeon]
MSKSPLLAFFLLLFSLSFASGAYSLPAVNSLLASYNVPGAVISTLSPVGFAYSGGSYVGMYNDSYPYFIVNVTDSKSYSLVLNSTAIYNIIRNYTLTASLSRVNFTLLNKQMQLYEASSAAPLADCAVETGLTSGVGCTVANGCQSCLFVPLCRCDLTGTSCPATAGQTPPGGGVSGVFGQGVVKFAVQYPWLNASFSAFLNASTNVTKSNVLENVATLNAAFLNITNLTYTISENPIFPPTANVTPNQIAGCASYINQTIAPWYCSALGYCGGTSYNYTRLAYISTLMGNLNTLAFSNQQIFALASNVSANESTYAYPLISKQRLAVLNALLNSTVPGYSALVNNSAALLLHVNNATLSSQLNALVSNYDNLTTNFFYANFTKANITLTTQYAAVEATYRSLNATYSDIISAAKNNTARVIEIQFSSSAYSSPQISSLALAQLALNAEIAAGGLSNLTHLDAQLHALSAQIDRYSIAPLTITDIARGIDAPFIRGLASTLGLSYPSAVSSAPLLGAILSLIIGVVLVVGLFFARSYLRLHRRLRTDSRTERNWRTIFVILGVAVFVYFLATYSLLSGANTSAPFGAFKSAYAASSYVVVAINGTSTVNELTCASTISSRALSANKTAVVATFSNGLCKTGNSTSTVDDCLNFYAKANIPVIELTTSVHSGISLYSLYGTLVSVAGNDSTMNSCYVAMLLNR